MAGFHPVGEGEEVGGSFPPKRKGEKERERRERREKGREEEGGSMYILVLQYT